MAHRSEYTCESAIYWNETASLINEKCNLECYNELTPGHRILDAGDYLLLAELPVPLTFCCKMKEKFQILQKVVHTLL